MQTLVQDLLKLSKTGRAEIKRNPIHGSLCQSGSENLALNLQEAENIIERDPLPDAVGDQTMIIQLYQNLISNAIKYTDKRPRKIKLTAELKNGKIVYGVRITVLGSSPNTMTRFFRLSACMDRASMKEAESVWRFAEKPLNAIMGEYGLIPFRAKGRIFNLLCIRNN